MITPPKECPVCKGTGIVRAQFLRQISGFFKLKDRVRISANNPTGDIDCPSCQGTGFER